MADSNGWLDWYRQRKDSITFSAAAFAVVLLGSFLFIKYRSDRKLEAQELFSQAQTALKRAPDAAGGNAQAEAEQQLSRVSAEFSDLPLGKPAALYEAEIMRDRGQFPQALDRIRRFLGDQEGKKDLWTAFARRNEAYYLELMGQMQEAKQAYMMLGEEKWVWISKEELDLGQARCLLGLGQKDAARALLIPISAQKPASYWTRSAEALLNI